MQQLLVAVRETTMDLLQALVGSPFLVDRHHEAVHLVHGLVELGLSEEGSCLLHETDETLFREHLPGTDPLLLLQ